MEIYSTLSTVIIFVIQSWHEVKFCMRARLSERKGKWEERKNAITR